MKVKIEIPYKLLELLHDNRISGKNATEFLETIITMKLGFDNDNEIEDIIEEFQDLIQEPEWDHLTRKR
jgi:myo-inositol catabolism protein IolC